MTKKSELLSYKGFKATVSPDVDDEIIYINVTNATSSLLTHVERMDEVVPAFHELIDEFLEFCQEEDIPSKIEFSGKFNVRISPKLHEKLSYNAQKLGFSLNETVNSALAQFIEDLENQSQEVSEESSLETEMWLKHPRTSRLSPEFWETLKQDKRQKSASVSIQPKSSLELRLRAMDERVTH